jgi:hypothetical protein
MSKTLNELIAKCSSLETLAHRALLALDEDDFPELRQELRDALDIKTRNSVTLTLENFPPLEDLQYMLAEVDADELPLLEEDDEPEDEICSGCSGSGEGMYDGATCTKCHGSGIEPVEKDDDL